MHKTKNKVIKIKMNNMIAIIILALIMCTPFTSAFAADTTTTGGDGVTATIGVTGTIDPLTISITHPISMAYMLVPQDPMPYSAATLTIGIRNNSSTPIRVTVESFAYSAGSDISPRIVSQNTFFDTLEVSRSNAIAYSTCIFERGNASEWVGYVEGASDVITYEIDEGTGTTPNVISPMVMGTLLSGTKGYIGLGCIYINSFDASYTLKNDITFRFSLV